jgi:hypothetical protein
MTFGQWLDYSDSSLEIGQGSASKLHAMTSFFSILVLSALGFAMYWLRYHDYILVGDEPAVISESLNQSFIQWFSEGFSRYFVVYPEWFKPITNFSRPIMNLLPYLNYLIFERDFQSYYIIFYILQFCGAIIISYFMRVADVPTGPSLLFVALFLFSPAFINFGLVMIPYQFDVVASIFALAAFLALWKGLYYLTVIMLLLAVLTKETALFAPIAAAITVFVWTRRPALAALLFSPFVLWCALRLTTYGTISGGTYAGAPGVWGAVTGLVKGIIVWPTGIIPGSGGLLRLITVEVVQPRTVVYAGMVLFNGALWIYLIHSAWIIGKKYFASEKAPYLDDRFRLVTGLLIWTLGALGVCVVLGLVECRYGASVYAFLFLFLPVFLFGRWSRPLGTSTRWVSCSITLMLAIACVWNAITFFATDFVAFMAETNRQRALYNALLALHSEGATVYVVNAPGGMGSAPKYLTTAWNVGSSVVFVNQVLGCTDSTSPRGDGLDRKPGGVLEVHIPKCASYKFSNADDSVLAAGVQGILERPGVGTYHFTDGRIAGHWFNNLGVPKIDFGQGLIIQFYDVNAPILAYNWNEGKYNSYHLEK